MRSRRKLVVSALVVLVLIIAAVGAYWGAVRLLGHQIESALGEGGEVGAIHVGLGGIDIEQLRVKARSNKGKTPWPTADELNAARIHVEPDLRSLFSDTIVIRSIKVEDARMTILRDATGLEILPGLRHADGKDKKKPASEDGKKTQSKTSIRIGSIQLSHCTIDFYDATVRHKPHHIALENIDTRLDDLTLPEMENKTTLSLRAQIGERGKLDLGGWLVPATADSQLHLKLAEVPMSAIEPYMIRNPATHVKHGTLDLDLRPTVDQRKLKAPGKLDIDGLELTGTSGLAGLGQEAAIALLRDSSKRISLEFALNGSLDDPKFSLNDEFYLRIGSALADSAGVGISNIGHSVGKGLGGLLKELTGN